MKKSQKKWNWINIVCPTSASSRFMPKIRHCTENHRKYRTSTLKHTFSIDFSCAIFFFHRLFFSFCAPIVDVDVDILLCTARTNVFVVELIEWNANSHRHLCAEYILSLRNSKCTPKWRVNWRLYSAESFRCAMLLFFMALFFCPSVLNKNSHSICLVLRDFCWMNWASFFIGRLLNVRLEIPSQCAMRHYSIEIKRLIDKAL